MSCFKTCTSTKLTTQKLETSALVKHPLPPYPTHTHKHANTHRLQPPDACWQNCLRSLIGTFLFFSPLSHSLFLSLLLCLSLIQLCVRVCAFLFWCKSMCVCVLSWQEDKSVGATKWNRGWSNCTLCGNAIGRVNSVNQILEWAAELGTYHEHTSCRQARTQMHTGVVPVPGQLSRCQ